MKNKLVTPMGEITILVDDVEIQYTYTYRDKLRTELQNKEEKI